jgi:hypothetical protein
MFVPKKPNAAAAKKELIHNIKVFALSIVAVRALPYLLEYAHNLNA